LWAGCFRVSHAVPRTYNKSAIASTRWALVRPRAIQRVPGLKADSSPGERFMDFTRMIVTVPKAEADRETNKANSVKLGVARKKKRI
jgi:hypothetical protein